MERSGGLQFPSLKTVLAVITGVMMLVDLYFIFMVAPTDAVLGHVQRVFYFHVPIAIMSFLAFFVVFIASLMSLFKRSPKWDAFAHASAEVGVIFVTLALITGIIWARPIWNTWWTWEPRLTTTLILWLIYVAYLMVRSYAPTQSKGAPPTARGVWRPPLLPDPSISRGGTVREIRLPRWNYGIDLAVFVHHVCVLLCLHGHGTHGTAHHRRSAGPD